MSEFKKQNQSRHAMRVNPLETVHVFFASERNKAGILKDVGLGGLSCEFTDTDIKVSDTGTLDISVFGKDKPEAGKLPYRKVADRLMNEDNADASPVRQVAVAFEDLANDQRSMLNIFIRAYTDAFFLIP